MTTNRCVMKDMFGGECGKLTTQLKTVFCFKHKNTMCTQCKKHHARVHIGGNEYACPHCIEEQIK